MPLMVSKEETEVLRVRAFLLITLPMRVQASLLIGYLSL